MRRSARRELPTLPDGPDLTGLWVFLVTLALVGVVVVGQDVLARIPLGADWQRAHGQVVTAEVVEERWHDKRGEHVQYRPHVVAAYVWQGALHTTDRRSPGADFGARAEAADAEREAARWRGTEPDVWVDAGQDDFAVLDTSLLPALGVFGGGVLGVCLMLGAIGGYALLVVRVEAKGAPSSRWAGWQYLNPRR